LAKQQIVKELIAVYRKQMIVDFKTNTQLPDEINEAVILSMTRKLNEISDENILGLSPLVIMGEIEAAIVAEVQDIAAQVTNLDEVSSHTHVVDVDE